VHISHDQGAFIENEQLGTYCVLSDSLVISRRENGEHSTRPRERSGVWYSSAARYTQYHSAPPQRPHHFDFSFAFLLESNVPMPRREEKLPPDVSHSFFAPAAIALALAPLSLLHSRRRASVPCSFILGNLS